MSLQQSSMSKPLLKPTPMAKASPFLALPAFLPLLSLLPLLSARNAFSGVVAADADRFFGDLLRSYGLPAGLLPKVIDSFTLDPTSGLLEVRLRHPCYARFNGGGLAYFDRVVSGNLSYGALGSVVGWSQEELFLWLPVKAILIDDPASGVILFDIGLAHKQLSASVFEEPPDCQPDAEAIKMAGEELHGRRRDGFQQRR
ncbi:uncharacterized protein LOC121968152 [Zingiber officinale]|uniref:uncharacterized protein LOC121968152 n=1 Tax=Zingiber officinale TaxID=94328 RepID=UPI001C4BB77D|nr:uncharacterized protein LOC121968152 [Zingiber officinale]